MSVLSQQDAPGNFLKTLQLTKCGYSTIIINDHLHVDQKGHKEFV